MIFLPLNLQIDALKPDSTFQILWQFVTSWLALLVLLFWFLSPLIVKESFVLFFLSVVASCTSGLLSFWTLLSSRIFFNFWHCCTHYHDKLCPGVTWWFHVGLIGSLHAAFFCRHGMSLSVETNNKSSSVCRFCLIPMHSHHFTMYYWYIEKYLYHCYLFRRGARSAFADCAER